MRFWNCLYKAIAHLRVHCWLYSCSNYENCVLFVYNYWTLWQIHYLMCYQVGSSLLQQGFPLYLMGCQQHREHFNLAILAHIISLLCTTYRSVAQSIIELKWPKVTMLQWNVNFLIWCDKGISVLLQSCDTFLIQCGSFFCFDVWKFVFLL